MNRRAACFSLLRRALARIHPVDRSLLLFLIVLLGQSAYSLFSNGGQNQLSGDIDIIVRTSSAAIFGYLLSGNFVDRSPDTDCLLSSAVRTIGPVSSARPESRLSGQIGFTDQDAPVSPGGTFQTPAPAKGVSPFSCLQVVTATAIGLFCLLALIVLRNVAPPDDPRLDSGAVTAIVAQFRDFVSGCVGFLIGFPTRTSDVG